MNRTKNVPNNVLIILEMSGIIPATINSLLDIYTATVVIVKT